MPLLQGIIDGVKSLTNSGRNTPSNAITNAITKETLFESIPADCDHECQSCTIKYPPKFEIDEKEALWNTADGWASHIVVATGETNWIRDVSEIKGTMMEALGSSEPKAKPENGKLMISASNMPLPHSHYEDPAKPTTVLLLPSFTIVDDVKPEDSVELVEKFINRGPTTTSPLRDIKFQEQATAQTDRAVEGLRNSGLTQQEGHSVAQSSEGVSPRPPVEITTTDTEGKTVTPDENQSLGLTNALSNLSVEAPTFPPVDTYLKYRPCPHDYLILLCSHKQRDARCGMSAPLLLKELRRHLAPLGLYRDLDDTRLGGVGIYFINHVGGHKWSANVMVYRKKEGQGIWLARVAPKDIENIVKWTVLQGKVSPDKIRAGFDRSRSVTSW